MLGRFVVAIGFAVVGTIGLAVVGTEGGATVVGTGSGAGPVGSTAGGAAVVFIAVGNGVNLKPARAKPDENPSDATIVVCAVDIRTIAISIARSNAIREIGDLEEPSVAP